MKKFTNMLVGVFVALLLATSAFAASNTPVATTTAVATNSAFDGEWVMTLGGSGATTTTDSETAFGINFSVGRTLNLIKGFPEEVGIRQGLGYASGNGGNTILSTRAYLDVTVLKFDLTKNIPVDIYVGGNIGPNYGNTNLKWVAAPEVGVDVWLAKNVAIDARLEYAFDLDNARSSDALVYVLGVKFKF